MIGRSAHDRQAQRDVHPLVEIERLQRDQRLIVIHAQRRIVALALARGEQGVGGMGAGDVDALGAQHGDCGGDDPRFLVADPALLAGMGIERGDGEARAGDAEIADQRHGDDPAAPLDQGSR